MTAISPLYSANKKKNPLSFFPRRELVKGAHGCASAALEHMHYTLVYADPPKTSGPLVPPIKFLMVHSLPSNFLGYGSMTPFCCVVTHPLLTDALMSSVLLYPFRISGILLS